VIGSYGSSKTQNFEDAIAHAQGVASLARAVAEQMSAVRKRRGIAYSLSFVWVL
jgi:hypothetical protein